MNSISDIYISGYARFFQLMEKWWGEGPGINLLTGSVYIAAHVANIMAVDLYLSELLGIRSIKGFDLTSSVAAPIILVLIAAQYVLIVRTGRHIAFLQKFEKEAKKQKLRGLVLAGTYLYLAPVSMFIYVIAVSLSELP